MRRTLSLAGLALLAASVAHAQNTAVIAGGPHDLSTGSALRNTNGSINGQTCVFCHTPHGGANSIPNWNRSTPTGTTYQLYTSSTSDVTTTGAQIAASVSGACMSCHDGTMAMDVLLNVNGLPFTPAVAFTRQAGAKATLRRDRRRHQQPHERRPAVPGHGPAQRPPGHDCLRNRTSRHADRVRDVRSSAAPRSRWAAPTRCRCSVRRRERRLSSAPAAITRTTTRWGTSCARRTQAAPSVRPVTSSRARRGVRPVIPYPVVLIMPRGGASASPRTRSP